MMKSNGLRLASLCAAALAAALLAGTAQAALQDRDLDKNGVTDASHDTDLDITWLRDANVNGQMNWSNAVAWADGYSIGKYADWRLPTSDTCSGYNCTGSEMGHLWHVELGNPVDGPMTNTGDFQNLQSSHYWSGQGIAPCPYNAIYFNMDMGNGYQDVGYRWSTFYALAVTPGDVAAVPEPQTVVLLMFGSAGLALALARRRRSGAGPRTRQSSLQPKNLARTP